MPVVNVKHVSHVALKSPNVERQATFYTDMVGLGETPRGGSICVVMRTTMRSYLSPPPSLELTTMRWMSVVRQNWRARRQRWLAPVFPTRQMEWAR